MEVFLNYYSKILSLLFVTILSCKISAMELSGVYLSSCHREVGLIVKADASYIFMFNMKGEVVKLPRYEVIGISSYPIEKFPINNLSFTNALDRYSEDINIFSIKTKVDKNIIPLATGWPIRFSKNKISLLSAQGEEISFPRSSIWEINKEQSVRKYEFVSKVTSKYDFLHPTALRKCPKQEYGQGEQIVVVAPQEFVSSPVAIKQRIDAIIEEQNKLAMYIRSQAFYAVSQVYQNKTTLGLWLIGGTKHAASDNRANNWAPIVENQFSSGPFGYQHIFYTGSNTNQFFIHEEPQTQFFYRFKADYFHLAYFMDPSLILMGKRYRWFENEIGKGEYRANDISFIELGFDFSNYSLLLQQSSEIQIGYKDRDNVFYDGQLTVPKIGIEFRNHRFAFNFLYGTSTENVRSDIITESNGDEIGYIISEFKFDILRLNYQRELNDIWAFKTSYIRKNFSVEESVTSTTVLSLETEYRLSYKYIINVLIADEFVSNEMENAHFLKLGLSTSLVF